MTHDASQTVPAPRPGTSQFVSGTVLGLALGIAAGHLLLFSRSTPEISGSTAEEEFAQLVASTPRFAAVDRPLQEMDSSSSILEFDGQEDVGRVRLSDQAEDGTHLHFFPEAMYAPATESIWHADTAPAGKPVTNGPLQMTADMSHASEPPPQALQPSPTATPIDKATSDRRERARSIIREELPEATAQEQEVWCDVLQGLPAEDIKGILRMRKHIGPGAALELWPPLALPSPQSDPADDTSPGGAPVQSTTAESTTGRRLRQIARHNQANYSSVAFKQQIPILAEAAADDPAGIAITGVIRDMRQGELKSTGRRLDVAIDGPGFLEVRRGDQVRYTRDGRLTLDAQGRLKLLAPDDTWLINPEISIPAGAIDIAISEDGKITAALPEGAESMVGTLRIVRFLDPSALDTRQEGLYQPTSASGAPHEATAAQQACGRILQGHLERSNGIAPAAHTRPLHEAVSVRR